MDRELQALLHAHLVPILELPCPSARFLRWLISVANDSDTIFVELNGQFFYVTDGQRSQPFQTAVDAAHHAFLTTNAEVN